MHNVFKAKYVDKTTIESIRILAQEMKNRDISGLDVMAERVFAEKERDRQFDILLKKEQSYSQKNEKTLIESSPFTRYYREKLKEYDEMLKQRMDSLNMPQHLNEFYCPALFNLLVDKLYSIPMWTGEEDSFDTIKNLHC